MSSSKVYFPGLNSLRFFAAMAVVFTHLELMKRFLAYGSHWIDMDDKIKTYPLDAVLHKDITWISPAVASSGPLGVVFFFVLSGFLITYLLFKEKEVLGGISIRKFYMRRILRIWPLYYTVTLIGFFALPHFAFFQVPIQNLFLPENFWAAFWMYIFFVPNLAFSMFVAIPNIGQAWSIGVEEQFYAIWPWLQKKFRNPLRTMLVFMGIMIGIKALFLLCVLGIDAPWVLKVKKFLVMLKLECMALGGVGAYFLYFNKSSILRWIYHPVVELMAYLSIPCLVYLTPMKVQNAVHLAYSVSFLIIIINVASNPKAIIKFRWKVLDYLGKISFGIYMYHMMCIVFSVHIIPGLMHAQSRDLKGIENLAIYSFATALTILVSAMSYHFLELPFIRMKKKVTTVISGDNAAN